MASGAPGLQVDLINPLPRQLLPFSVIGVKGESETLPGVPAAYSGSSCEMDSGNGLWPGPDT